MERGGRRDWEGRWCDVRKCRWEKVGPKKETGGIRAEERR